MKPNLFTILHRLPQGRDEDFLTEGLVYVIGHLLEFSPTGAGGFLKKITGGVVGENGFVAEETKIRSQFYTAHGRPDIVITTPGAHVLVEVKVEASLGWNQLDSYRQALAKVQDKKKWLVLLSPGKLEGEEQADHIVRWFEVGKWMSELLELQLDEISQFLVAEYIGFLQDRGVMFWPPKSSVSRGLVTYLAEAGEDNIFSGPAIKSLKNLNSHPDLLPLDSLLKAMRKCIKKVMPDAHVKVGAGKGSTRGGGWIGFNINQLEHFFVVYLHQADIVTYEAYTFPTDPNKFDGSEGELYKVADFYMWTLDFDLAHPDVNFYELGDDAQLDVLEYFLSSSLEMAMTMAP